MKAISYYIDYLLEQYYITDNELSKEYFNGDKKCNSMFNNEVDKDESDKAEYIAYMHLYECRANILYKEAKRVKKEIDKLEPKCKDGKCKKKLIKLKRLYMKLRLERSSALGGVQDYKEAIKNEDFFESSCSEGVASIKINKYDAKVKEIEKLISKYKKEIDKCYDKKTTKQAGDCVYEIRQKMNPLYHKLERYERLRDAYNRKMRKRK